MIISEDVKKINSACLEIGADPTLVQGPGGNVSIKDGDRLIVKASGTWLSEAQARNIFVSGPLEATRRAIAATGDIKGVAYQSLDDTAHRPSIETTLHALMPHRVVIHVHCVNTIAYAVRQDAQAALSDPLADFAWGFVPYLKPGPTLAARVGALVDEQARDVIVLGNHGLLVGAATVAEAMDRLEAVHNRLAPSAPLPAAEPHVTALEASAAELGLTLPDYEHSHVLARTPACVSIVAGGSLYPDHVVFLGRGVTVIKDAQAPAAPAAKIGLAVLPGLGVLVNPNLSPAGQEMVRALALVTERIPDGVPIRYLAAAEEDALLDWDAEKYRQGLSS